MGKKKETKLSRFFSRFLPTKPVSSVQSQPEVFHDNETGVKSADISEQSSIASLNPWDEEAELLPDVLQFILQAQEAPDNLLRLLAHLEPNGTSLAFLQAGSKALDPILRNEVLNANGSLDILIKLEMSGQLEWNRFANTIVIPASIRQTVMDTLPTHEKAIVLSQIIKLCVAAFPADVNVDTLDICRLYESEVEYALQWCDFIHTRNSAMILTRFGNFLFREGKYKDSERYLLKGMEILNEVIESDHSHALNFLHEDIDIQNLGVIKHCLAECLLNQDRIEEAERIQLEVVKTSQELLGMNNIETLASMHNLMLTYLKQDKLSSAVELGLEIIEKLKLVHGESHPHTLMTMSLLASVYSQQGRLAEAEGLLETVLKKQLTMLPQQLGIEDLTMTMNNLAGTYAKRGKLDEAIQLWKDAIVNSEKTSRSEHPSTLIIMHNLAFDGYDPAGLTQEAIVLGENVLEKKLGIFNKSHSSVINTMQGLAALYLNTGDMIKATEMLKQLFHIHKSSLGESHLNTIKAAHRLRDAYVEQGRNEEAAEILKSQQAPKDKLIHMSLPLIFANVDTADWDEMSPEDLMLNQWHVHAYPSYLAGSRALKYSRAGKSPLYDDIGFRVFVTIPRRGPTALQTIPRLQMERNIADRTRKNTLVEKIRHQVRAIQHRYLQMPPMVDRVRYGISQDGLIEFTDSNQDRALLSMTHAPDVFAGSARDVDEPKIYAQFLRFNMPGTFWLPLTALIRAGRFMTMQEFRSDLAQSTSPDCFYLFLSHRWLSSEQPDPDDIQARVAAWQIVGHLCEAINVASLRGLNVSRKMNYYMFQAPFGISGSKLAEALIVNLLRRALNNELALEQTMKEVQSLDEFIEDYGTAAAKDDIGLCKLNAILDSRPNFRALLQKIYVWYDYSCLPQKPWSQEDERLFRKGLHDLLPTLLLGRTAILLDNVEDYISRAWCLYECLAADSLSNMDLLAGSPLPPTLKTEDREIHFFNLIQFRPHIVWRAILDTEVFAVQSADTCMARLGLSATDPNDTLLIYEELKRLPGPTFATIDPSELITGVFPLPVVSGTKNFLIPRDLRKSLEYPRAVEKKITLDWTQVIRISTGWTSGQCDAAILPFLKYKINVDQSWSSAHIAIVAGSEGEAVLFTNWVVRHRDDLERALEMRTTSISWLSSDIASVGHCVLGTLRAAAVDALVWIIVSLESRFQFCEVTSAIIETVIAANLRHVTLAVDLPENNVTCFVPMSDTEAKRIHSDGFNLVDIAINDPVEHIGGLFRSSVTKDLLKPTDSSIQQNRIKLIPDLFDILEGERVRDLLFAALHDGRQDEFFHACQNHQSIILKTFSSWKFVPEKMYGDPSAIEKYAQNLLHIAKTFKSEGHSQLMTSLAAQNGNDTAAISWEQRVVRATQMSDIGDYEKSNSILQVILHDMEGGNGSHEAVRDHHLFPKILGRLGKNALLMDDIPTAVTYTKRALEACEQRGDHAGVHIYRETLQIAETVMTLSLGTEIAVHLSSIIDSIINAQQLSDKGRYLKSNIILQELLMNLSKNETNVGDVYRGKIYGLLGSNHFKLGDRDEAREFTNMALQECERVGDGYGSKIYKFNLREFS